MIVRTNDCASLTYANAGMCVTVRRTQPALFQNPRKNVEFTEKHEEQSLGQRQGSGCMKVRVSKKDAYRNKLKWTG